MDRQSRSGWKRKSQRKIGATEDFVEILRRTALSFIQYSNVSAIHCIGPDERCAERILVAP
jgi:hypothetical protein